MIAYRDAGPDDAAAVRALFERSFVATFGPLYRPQDLASFLAGFTEDAWRRELSDPAFQIRLVEQEGEAAGFAKLGPLGLPVEPRGRALELRQLYVAEAWHGRGIAQTLMEWVLERVRLAGAAELYLSVYSDNHRAKAFYRRYGFDYVGPYDFMVGEQADEDEIWRLSLE